MITLGIIGVVAALTLPQLIDNYDKIIFETRAKAFYTQINEAFRRSYVENEEPYYWIEAKNYTNAQTRAWLDKYLFPYMKNTEVVDCNLSQYVGNNTPMGQNFVCFRMANGALVSFSIDNNGADIAVYPKGYKLSSSKTKLLFQFVKSKSGSNPDIKSRESINFVEPYTYNWNGTRNGLKAKGTWGCFEGCGDYNNNNNNYTNCGYCTKLLQLNGWKIPKDYPW